MSERKLIFVLAEDNPGDVFLIRRALDEQRLYYQLAVVTDGEEAIRFVLAAAASEDQIDLVLLDLNLPRRDGSEVLTEMRNCPGLAAVPTVVITSSDSPDDRERALRLGANHFFHKPSDLMKFMDIGRVVRELIEKAPLQAAV
jgi:CheY-like chemotaxis protein